MKKIGILLLTVLLIGCSSEIKEEAPVKEAPVEEGAE